jgi:hypothetical protein
MAGFHFLRHARVPIRACDIPVPNAMYRSRRHGLKPATRGSIDDLAGGWTVRTGKSSHSLRTVLLAVLLTAAAHLHAQTQSYAPALG